MLQGKLPRSRKADSVLMNGVNMIMRCAHYAYLRLDPPCQQTTVYPTTLRLNANVFSCRFCESPNKGFDTFKPLLNSRLLREVANHTLVPDLS